MACRLRGHWIEGDLHLVLAVRQAEKWTQHGREVLPGELGSPVKVVKRRGSGKGANKSDAPETLEDVAEARPPHTCLPHAMRLLYRPRAAMLR